MSKKIFTDESLATLVDETKLYTDASIVSYSDVTNTELASEISGDDPELDPSVEARFTELENELTQTKSDLTKTAKYITPEMYGAVGDGVTDDSEAIQTAIDNAGSTNVVYLAKKNYLVSDTLKINTRYARFICDGTLNYSGAESAIEINNSNIQVFISLIRAASGTAIKLNGGASVCDIEIHSIRSSVIGCHLYGVDNNITYNKLRIGQILSSDIDIFIEKVSSYVNENYFWLSNIRGESNYGIKIVGGGGNKFFSGGLEGISDTGCGIYIEDGEANEFHGIRCAENYGANSVILKGICSRNIFELSACELNEVDISELTGGDYNYIHSPYLTTGGYMTGERAELSYKFGKTYNPCNVNTAFDVDSTSFPDNVIDQVNSNIPTTLRCKSSNVNGVTYTLGSLYSEYGSLAKGFPVTFVFGGNTVGLIKLLDSRGNTILDNTTGAYANKTLSVRWNGYDKWSTKALWDIQILGEVSATQEYVQNYSQPKGEYLTEHQSLSGYAKTADHYTKTESDNKYQPTGNYLTSHQDISGKADKSSAETWTFTLTDGSTVTKKVVLA